MMKAMDERPSPSTQPMPTSEAMLNGACAKPSSSMRNLLMMPIRGWSKNTQPMEVKNVGTSAPMVARAKIKFLPGKSVRSTSQAIGTAKNSAIKTVVVAKPKVLSSVR